MSKRLRGVNPPGGPTRGRVGAGDRTPTALASGEAFLGGEYTAAEWEYIRAVAAWQKARRVRYPAATDYLSILVGLGYSKGRCAVNWVTVFEKLSALKKLATETAPGALDRAADVLHAVEDAVREAGELLRKLDAGPELAFAAAEDVEYLGKLEVLKFECEDEASRHRFGATAAPAGSGWEVLLPLVVRVIEELLRRRRG